MRVGGDNRPHIQIAVNKENFTVLLDSGAQSTIVGQPFQPYIEQLKLRRIRCNAVVKTADATEHIIQSGVELPIHFNGVTRTINALFVPNMPKLMIAGIDFWDKFEIRPIVCQVVEDIKVIAVRGAHNLSQEQAVQLSEALKLMPFSKEGELSKTKMIVHKIDTGSEKPIRQRQYIVSPYIQKDINTEIDRLLSLGVIYACPGSE